MAANPRWERITKTEYGACIGSKKFYVKRATDGSWKVTRSPGKWGGLRAYGTLTAAKRAVKESLSGA